MNSLQRTIIIISTGRTGTKFFAKLFGQRYPQMRVYHDSPFTPFLNILGNMALTGYLPSAVLRKVWIVLKSREVLECSREIYLDANNHLYAFIGLVPDVYPNVKVVNIVRDPRTYVRSHINWAYSRRRSYFANFWLPFWQPNGFLLREVSYHSWRHFSRLERFCWIWKFKNTFANEVVGIGSDYLQVRFEDFFGSDQAIGELERLTSFLSLPMADCSLGEFSRHENASLNRKLDPWQGWGDQDCARLDAICGEVMRMWGYGFERDWSEKVKRGYVALRKGKAS